MFQDPKFLAAQIGASEELVKGLINVWTAIKENLVLCPKKFYDYCQTVKALYVEEFPDYR